MELRENPLNCENIESSWPIFICFMIIDAIFKNDENQLNEYTTMLNEILKIDSNHNDYIIPKYYYVGFRTV